MKAELEKLAFTLKLLAHVSDDIQQTDLFGATHATHYFQAKLSKVITELEAVRRKVGDTADARTK